MKRLIAIMVIGLLVFNFGLAGCKKKAPEPTPPPPAEETNGNGEEPMPDEGTE